MGEWTTPCCSTRGPACSPTCRPATTRRPTAVSVLEDAVAAREWWAEQWPEGEVYVAGLVAQDVQDALFETAGRWPVCLDCGDARRSTRCTSSPTSAAPTRCGSARSRGDVVAPLGGL